MSVCTAAKTTPNSAVDEAERERDHAPPPELRVRAGRRSRAAGRRSRSSASRRSSAPKPATAPPDAPRAARRAAAAGPPWRRSRTARGRTRSMAQRAGQRLRAHRGERVVAGAALQHAEAEQDARSRRRARSAGRGSRRGGSPAMRCSVVTRKNDASAIDLPRHHEHVGVVGDQHQRHRREEDVVLEADEARAACLRSSGNSRRRTARSRRPRRPSSSRKNADSASRRRWNGRSGRPSGSTAVCGGAPIAQPARRPASASADQRAGGKQRAADEAQVARAHEPERADDEPRHDRGDDERERRRGHRRTRRQRSQRRRIAARVSLDAHAGLRAGVGREQEDAGTVAGGGEHHAFGTPNFILRGARFATIGVSRPTSCSGS